MEKEDLLKWYDETYCLEAVKENGYALQFVKEQTEEICLEAIEQNWDALRYVREQTEDICIAALQQNLNTIEYCDIVKFPKVWEWYQFSIK